MLLQKIIELTINNHNFNKTPLLIEGGVGVGKTSFVKSIAKKMGYADNIHLTSQLLPYDILGLPKIENDVTKMAKPAILDLETPKTIIIFDEFNMGSIETNSALQSLITDRAIGKYNLPDETILIFLCNDENSNANINPLTSPIYNRLKLVKFKPDYSFYKDYMKENNFNKMVVSFLKLTPEFLYVDKDLEKLNCSFPSPRSWESLSKDLNFAFGQDFSLFNKEQKDDFILLEEIIKMNIGYENTSNIFLSFIKEDVSKEKFFNIEEMLQDPLKYPVFREETKVLNIIDKTSDYLLPDNILDRDIVNLATIERQNFSVIETILTYLSRYKDDFFKLFINASLKKNPAIEHIFTREKISLEKRKK